MTGRRKGRGGRLPHAPLTQRQQEIVRLVVQGRSNKEIASALRISESAVKDHVSRLLRRYEVSSRLLLAETALAEALLPNLVAPTLEDLIHAAWPTEKREPQSAR